MNIGGIIDNIAKEEYLEDVGDIAQSRRQVMNDVKRTLSIG